MYEYVSVILPVRNEKDHIYSCLDSLLSQDYPNEKLEILAIDGMSSDGTKNVLAEYSEKYENIKIFDNPDKVVPAALNIGINNAKGEYIIRIDAHATYPAGYISSCVRWLQKTRADNAGGFIETIGQGYIGEAIALALSSFFGVGNSGFRTLQKSGYVDTVPFGAFRREVFDKYGLFDESLVRNQDIEMNARVKKGGGRIYLTPEIKSTYFCRNTLAGLLKQNSGNGYWNILTVKKHPGTLSLRHFIPLIFISSLIILGIFSPFSVIARLLFVFDIFSYLLTNLMFSLRISYKKGLKYLPILPLVFFILHFSYGMGSLWAVIKNILSSKKDNLLVKFQ